MKIFVIGATGTIGTAVADALAARHEVHRGARRGSVPIDVTDPTSVAAAFARLRDLDAVVCCAGNARFKPLDALSDDDIYSSIRSKLLAQVLLARVAMDAMRDGGSITLTSGALAQHPVKGSAAVSMVCAGIDAFVRAAALEMPRGMRINAVSPSWVEETLRALGRDASGGTPARDVAAKYVALVEGTANGEVVGS